MRKRQKLVLTACLLSGGLIVVQSTPLEWKYVFIAILTALTWILSGWSLKEGLAGVEWLTVLIPPALFTASIGLFYILLPESIWARLAIVALFGVGQYALLLSANIFSVAAIRTIALLRAAIAVEFAMTLLTGFFLYDTILSFRLAFWEVGVWVVLVSWLLLFPGLWSIKLEKRLTNTVLKYSIILAIMIGLLAMAISFWPVGVAVSSLFLCTMLYVFLGISQHHFQDRLFSRTVGEYIVVGMVVLVTMLLTSGWGS